MEVWTHRDPTTNGAKVTAKEKEAVVATTSHGDLRLPVLGDGGVAEAPLLLGGDEQQRRLCRR